VFEDDVTVEAGWYPDPMGLPQLRWWNNHAWTELTTEARPPLVMQEQSAPSQPRLLYADDELPTRRQQREQRERDEEFVRLATDEQAERDAAAAYAPFTSTLREINSPVPVGTDPDNPPMGSQDADEAEVRRGEFTNDLFDDIFQPRSATTAVSAPTAQNERTRTAEPATPGSRETALPHLLHNTGPVWIIALLPLLQLVVGLLILLAIGASQSFAFTIAFLGAPYLITVLLAIGDRATLRRAGHERTAHWAWAFLSAPVYLLVRSISLGRTGELSLGPLLAWVALGMLQIGSILVVPGMLISVIPTVFSAQAQQSVQSEAIILGASLSVDCPASPPLLIGQQFTCTATSGSGKQYDVKVSLQRANGWIDWRVDDWDAYPFNR
jgi:hypothetical protein